MEASIFHVSFVQKVICSIYHHFWGNVVNNTIQHLNFMSGLIRNKMIQLLSGLIYERTI